MLVDLDAVLSIDLSALDQVDLQERAVLVQQAIDRLTGHRNDLLGELSSRHQGNVVDNPGSEHAPKYRLVQHWWRDEMTLTGSQAGAQVRLAGKLRELPVIQAAVTAGRLAPEQARVLARLHGRINLADLQDSQPHLIEVAASLDTDALGRFVAHLIATHCEPALEADQDRAHERRHLQVTTEPDGSVRGRFLLASEDAEAVLTVLEPLARRGEGEGEDRTAGQRRADALVDVFTAAAAWMDLPQAGGQRAQVSYVVPAAWAAAQQRRALAETLAAAGQHPLGLMLDTATGAWTGPQTRARIESVLCDARISRVFLNPTGQVQSLYSLDDQITKAQRRAVSARDRHCVARGCTRPPAFCDVHHLQARADGGLTCVENLVLLCRRHHVLWHKGVIGLHDLWVPWLPDPEPDEYDPWGSHDPPLVA
jgi:hypothetical protein